MLKNLETEVPSTFGYIQPVEDNSTNATSKGDNFTTYAQLLLQNLIMILVWKPQFYLVKMGQKCFA